jgi:hypothetical protein
MILIVYFYKHLLDQGLSHDEADKVMERKCGQVWAIVQDEVWDWVSPEHRARKYEEQAIADSKLPEVDYEPC